MSTPPPNGSRFSRLHCRHALPYPEVAGAHPVHDTVVTRYRHLDVFRHAGYLEARTPRVRRGSSCSPGRCLVPRRPAPSASRAPECTTICYASTCGPHVRGGWICARILILHLDIISTFREFDLTSTYVHRLANGTPACAQIMNCTSKIYKRIFLKDCQIPGGKNMKLIFDPPLRSAYKKQTFYRRECGLQLCLAPVDASRTASVLCGTARRCYAAGARGDWNVTTPMELPNRSLQTWQSDYPPD